MNTLVVGTRGSALATRQTDDVIAALRRRHPNVLFSTQIITTYGDRVTYLPLQAIGGRGVFVKEIEAALLDGAIDLAVHSLKDLPAETPDGLVLAAFPERADPRDAFLSRDGTPFLSLPAGSRVGTSSPRRAAQLRHHRPDLVYVDLRGNVDTRLRKLDQGNYDAIVLAAAGLQRLDRLATITEYLSDDLCLPSFGQGILGVEIRSRDTDLARVLAEIDDSSTRAAAIAERALLRAFGAGCTVPLAGHARFVGPATLQLDGLVASPDGATIVCGRLVGPSDDPEALARKLYEQLCSDGASALLGSVESGR